MCAGDAMAMATVLACGRCGRFAGLSIVDGFDLTDDCAAKLTSQVVSQLQDTSGS